MQIRSQQQGYTYINGTSTLIYTHIDTSVCIISPKYVHLVIENLIESQLNLFVFWFGLVGFYGISIIVGYLMPNPLYTYILNIYDLV